MPRMLRPIYPALFLALLTVGCAERPAHASAQRLLMGTTFRVQVVTADAHAGEAAIEAALDEVARVEERLSEWKATSEISAVNRAAGEPAAVAVGPELLEVVRRALEISQLTAGAFDITYASCGHLWSFREPRVPEDDEIAQCLADVDYRRVELDAGAATIRLPDAAMKIGISAIGKGYGVDRAAAVLEARGIHDYTVDGGGDLRVRGRNVDRPWRIGIADPRRPGALSRTVGLSSGSLVTSGDYMLFFERDGRRYHHILDPRTGRPAQHAIAVTVMAPTAMDADALATGLFVLGPQRGLELVETLPGVEALITAPDRVEHASSGFPRGD
jgi:thiamine biosynthesis lipoprotein